MKEQETDNGMLNLPLRSVPPFVQSNDCLKSSSLSHTTFANGIEQIVTSWMFASKKLKRIIVSAFYFFFRRSYSFAD